MVAALSPTLPRSLGYAFLTHRPVQSPVLQLSSVRRPNQGWRHYRTEEARRCPQAALAESSTEESTRGQALLEWLDSHGIPEQKVELNTIVREGRTLDVTVASQDMEPGDLALRIPEDLVITLRSVFEDGTVAEILTTGKLSELACLTLYLMYEKKMGRDSIWYQYIKELDYIQARGQMGAKSPLLWSQEEVASLLKGSPLADDVKERLRGIEKEYKELDTVWFMAGSLFRNYPYDIPTEAFSFNLFKQAFAAVQASVVHLQGVPLCKRFALVPLGPPLLSYSSTAKALLQYDPESQEVRLAVDRAYRKGEPVYAWCGPQPNRRLFLNYGIVDESSPFDNLAVTATLPSGDPLFQAKRQVLQALGLSTQHTFSLLKGQKLPPLLLPFMRVAFCNDENLLKRPSLAVEVKEGPLSSTSEAGLRSQLQSYLTDRLARYPRTIQEDEEIIACPTSGPREKVAARLVRIEKQILQGALADLDALPGLDITGGDAPKSGLGVRLT